MSYDIQFAATSSAGWAQAVEMIDASTNLPFDLVGVTVEMDVRDECGAQRLQASSADGTIVMPEPNVIQWRFTPAQVGTLCKKTTYRVGCTLTDAGGTIQLFIGSLAFIDGNVS